MRGFPAVASQHTRPGKMGLACFNCETHVHTAPKRCVHETR